MNECSTSNGGCDGQCTNTKGSYTCSCESGFVVGTNGRSCEGTHFVPAESMYFIGAWQLILIFKAPVCVREAAIIIHYCTALDLLQWKCMESYGAIWDDIALSYCTVHVYTLYRCFLHVRIRHMHTNFTLLHMSGLNPLIPVVSKSNLVSP